MPHIWYMFVKLPQNNNSYINKRVITLTLLNVVPHWDIYQARVLYIQTLGDIHNIIAITLHSLRILLFYSGVTTYRQVKLTLISTIYPESQFEMCLCTSIT